MDDLNEFPDSWVELYNPTSQDINLEHYRLGITDQASEAWKLPYKMIGSGKYLLVYCDKESKSLHTNFRLDSGKGSSVYLFQGSTVVDKVTGLKKQPSPNIAYGRKTDGAEEWGYQLTPTPNEANTGEICDHDHILGDPVFSEPGRVFNGTKSFNLVLSLPEGCPEGTEIHYTTNGSEPTLFSSRYISEIPITKSTAVRAKLFCSGWLSPVSTVQSYIFHDRNLTIPIISLVTDDKYLNDYKLGIFKNNYGHEKYQQVDWRRPINIELFDTEAQPSQLNQLCETRITGAWSREAARKSMAIYAHKRFGKKNMDYEFFPDQCPGLTNYKSVVLRNAGNDRDYIYMRDAIAQRTMAEHVNMDWQAWRPAVIYINGNYWGILNIRERANANNIITHYNGLEDIDLYENGELKPEYAELLSRDMSPVDDLRALDQAGFNCRPIIQAIVDRVGQGAQEGGTMSEIVAAVMARLKAIGIDEVALMEMSHDSGVDVVKMIQELIVYLNEKPEPNPDQEGEGESEKQSVRARIAKVEAAMDTPLTPEQEYVKQLSEWLVGNGVKIK
jgi:hypothetical protein